MPRLESIHNAPDRPGRWWISHPAPRRGSKIVACPVCGRLIEDYALVHHQGRSRCRHRQERLKLRQEGFVKTRSTTNAHRRYGIEERWLDGHGPFVPVWYRVMVKMRSNTNQSGRTTPAEWKRMVEMVRDSSQWQAAFSEEVTMRGAVNAARVVALPAKHVLRVCLKNDRPNLSFPAFANYASRVNYHPAYVACTLQALEKMHKIAAYATREHPEHVAATLSSNVLLTRTCLPDYLQRHIERIHALHRTESPHLDD